MYMAIITSPENQKNLTRYKDISKRLALAENLTDDQARALASEGKAVVWIDGGLHANEVLGAQQLIETVYQQVSRTDPETIRFLNDVVLLAVCVNPDGLDLVADWYMREANPQQRSIEGLPRLYEKYAGHDDNRDFYMSALPETEAINRILFREWFPQIVYNHHQTGPEGAVMFAPPFRNPFNFNLDPLIPIAIDMVGAAMHARFIAEGKAGVTMRSGYNYSTWWNGGLRTTPYFHNQIGILTETIGSPTPINIPFVAQRQLPTGDLPFPIAPQQWHFRQSIEYSITANRAVMDVASRNRDLFLFNAYRMGKNSIERGMTDSWTAKPRLVEFSKSYESLREPSLRDARGYILPADQPDFLTATKFIDALIKNGIAVERATAAFTVSGKTYPAGSFIVRSAQAFRPHVLDMFEPQDHPDDFAYPGAAPTPPYDIAGWTLAYQMGVRFDRILEAFNGPFERINDVKDVKPRSGRIVPLGAGENPVGYLLSHETNDSFIAVNRLLAAKEEVYWMRSAFTARGKTYPAGTQFIPATPRTLSLIQRIASEIGLDFEAVGAKPQGEALMLRPVKIGLWDRYGGSVPSGWTRYIFEKFEFPFSVVQTNVLDAGDLAKKYDVLVLVTDTEITADQTIPQLRKFLEDGGTVLAIGQATSLAPRLGLAISNPVGNLARTKFYVPGSVLQVKVDTNNPLAYGMSDMVDVFFDSSPSFKLQPTAGQSLRPVAWYDRENPLRSGWAWGQENLKDTVAVAEGNVGKGKVFLFGPEILFRAQSHGTFKFLFNGMYYGRAETTNPGKN
jgi:hypothetical protein